MHKPPHHVINAINVQFLNKTKITRDGLLVKGLLFCEPCAREVGKNVTNTENHDNSVVLKETKEQRM